MRFPMKPNKLSTMCVTIILSSMTGCKDGRPSRVPVSGILKIENQPFIAGGNIVFQPTKGRTSSGFIDKESRFKIGTFETADGCPIGGYKITVDSIDMLGSTTRRWNIPKKYHQLTTSDIKKTIEGPTDSLVIDLSWGNGPKEPVVEKIDSGDNP